MVAALKLGAKHAPGSIYGLVNNAGVAAGSTEAVLDVNYFGAKRATQAFLPLINPITGRIVNISSASGPMVRT
jgi:NAD(P)-dependent dehydrogenase (short-subunit alcohol dehydrogenase family)